MGVSQLDLALLSERKCHELDRTTDPQRVAVLTGELADIGRAKASLARGKRITKHVLTMLSEAGGDRP
jgi:hypothetical protein